MVGGLQVADLGSMQQCLAAVEAIKVPDRALLCTPMYKSSMSPHHYSGAAMHTRRWELSNGQHKVSTQQCARVHSFLHCNCPLPPFGVLPHK